MDEKTNTINSSPKPSPISLVVEIVTHPAAMVLAVAASIFLWMPFGMGYYGYPWEDESARWMLTVLVKAFPVWAATACVLSLLRKQRTLRFVVSLVALWTAIYGVKCMTGWVPAYLEHLKSLHR